MVTYIGELIKFRELLFALSGREIKVRYKQTLLGVSWAVIQPLTLMAIFTLVFSFFLEIDSENIPYPIFAFSALLPWTFFATSLSFGSLSIINNGNLITKIYFPREVLPFSSILAAFLDFLIGTLLFLAMIFIWRVPMTVNIVYAIPIISLAVIFTAAVVLFTSALNVIWRDIKFVVPLVLQLWLFATPVIYPISRVPESLRVFYLLNPMAPVIDNFRRVTVGQSEPDWGALFIAFLISMASFAGALWFFKLKEKIFADII